MRDHPGVLFLMTFGLALSSLGAGRPAKTEKPMTEPASEAKSPGTRVARWLVLGPAPDPLPAFHDEKPGGYGVEGLLKAETFPPEARRPAEGSDEAWFGGARLAWSARDGALDGTLDLAPPEEGGRPASAWLAAYLETDRFRSVELEVLGTHPRRAWLDGEPVAAGGTEEKEAPPSPVKGKLALTTGKHLLVVRTVYDPARGGPWRSGAVLRGAEGEPAPPVGATLDPSRVLDILDILDAPVVKALAVAPDGVEAAATLSRVIPGTDDSESWVEIRRVADGSLVRAFRGGPSVSQVEYDPAGRFLSYATTEKGSGDSPDKTTLWLLDRATQEVRQLLERVESFSTYAWSPCGGAIAYSVTVKPEPDKRGVKRIEGLLDRQRDFRTKSYLHLAVVPEGTRRRLTAGALSAGGGAFSPDGGRMVFLREVEDVSSRPYSRKEIWEIDLRTFEARKLRDGWWVESAQYSPDGKRLLIQAGPSEFGSAGVKVPDGTVPNEGDGQLYVWDPALGQVDPITRDFDPAVVGAWWSRADGAIYIKAEDRDRVRLFRYDPVSRAFTPLDAGVDVVREVAWAAAAPRGAASGTSPWAPEAAFAVDAGGARPTLLLRPSGDRLAGLARGAVEPFAFRASSGREIDGRVYLPPGFDPAARYPVLVYYYGGTSPVGRDFGGRYPKEWWAANGYVVYVLQPSGATGFGQAFSSLHVNDWGEIVSREIIEGTKAFLAAHPYADPAKVGCIGASFGGFMTEVLLTRTDLFAAAVSHAGISSISSYWGEGYWGYSYSALATAGSFPWNRKDIYVDRSPLFHADKVKTPLLLTHGASDTNVPPGESASFYTALKLLGSPVEQLEIEGTDHVLEDHAKRAVWSRAVLAWFDRWLKGQPEWWEHLFPPTK